MKLSRSNSCSPPMLHDIAMALAFTRHGQTSSTRLDAASLLVLNSQRPASHQALGIDAAGLLPFCLVWQSLNASSFCSLRPISWPRLHPIEILDGRAVSVGPIWKRIILACQANASFAVWVGGWALRLGSWSGLRADLQKQMLSANGRTCAGLASSANGE